MTPNECKSVKPGEQVKVIARESAFFGRVLLVHSQGPAKVVYLNDPKDSASIPMIFNASEVELVRKPYKR